MSPSTALARLGEEHPDPSRLDFPPMLPFELALRTAPVAEVCEAYGIDRDQFVDLCATPRFVHAFRAAQDEVAKEGVSFRIKARLQADALLGESWKMIHSPDTPNTVKADLIKSTVRWAGYEPKNGADSGLGNAFQININLGS